MAGDSHRRTEVFLARAVSDLAICVERTVTEPAGWDDLVETLEVLFPGVAGGVVRQTAQRTGGLHAVSWMGVDAVFQQLYADHFATRNPFMPMWLGAGDGEVLVTNDVLPVETYARTAFVADWLDGQRDLRAATGIRLGAGDSSIAFLGVHYPRRQAPVYDRTLAQVLLRLRPKMMQVRRLSERLETQLAAAEDRAALLAREAGAAFVITVDGRLRDANATGLRWLEEGRVLRERRGRLSPVDPRMSQWLSVSLMTTMAADEAARDIVVQDEMGPLELVLCRLPGGTATNLLVDTPPRFLLLMRHLVPSPDEGGLAALARAYRLTPAETALCRALRYGAPLREAGDTVGITYETARDRLKQIFAKTDTARQVDLVALLTRIG